MKRAARKILNVFIEFIRQDFRRDKGFLYELFENSADITVESGNQRFDCSAPGILTLIASARSYPNGEQNGRSVAGARYAIRDSAILHQRAMRWWSTVELEHYSPRLIHKAQGRLDLPGASTRGNYSHASTYISADVPLFIRREIV